MPQTLTEAPHLAGNNLRCRHARQGIPNKLEVSRHGAIKCFRPEDDVTKKGRDKRKCGKHPKRRSKAFMQEANPPVTGSGLPV